MLLLECGRCSPLLYFAGYSTCNMKRVPNVLGTGFVRELVYCQKGKPQLEPKPDILNPLTFKPSEILHNIPVPSPQTPTANSHQVLLRDHLQPGVLLLPLLPFITSLPVQAFKNDASIPFSMFSLSLYHTLYTPIYSPNIPIYAPITPSKGLYYLGLSSRLGSTVQHEASRGGRIEEFQASNFVFFISFISIIPTIIPA